MQISDFLSAIKQLSDEKNISQEIVLEAVEAALAAAYRKDYGKPGQLIKVSLSAEKNSMKVWRSYTVVDEDEEITNPEIQLTVEQATKFKKKAQVGDEIDIPLEEQTEFGRVAAQTAKQVIIQRLREAEREMLYEEFKGKESKIVNGVVQRIEGPNVIIDLGKINGIMIPQDQIPGERYYTGQRLKVWVSEVEETNKGPRILVTRSSSDFVRALFAQEVPEIENGSIEISHISREAGSRTKIAVFTNDENLDPVGSVVGQRGTRVQSVLTELPNEKIDIILYDENVEQFIKNALSPAQVDEIKFDKKKNIAKIWVADDQLSLAIGRAGQNVRLASKLTGWTLDIVKEHEKPAEDAEKIEDKEGAPLESDTKKSKKVTKKTTKSSKSGDDK
jgi:N utilization substance protein A